MSSPSVSMFDKSRNAIYWSR